MFDDQSEFIQINLSADRDAMNATALVPEVAEHLGGNDRPAPPELPADVRSANVMLRIGRCPIVLDLAAVYAASGRELPPEYAIASPHRLCLIILAVGLLNEGSFERVARIGLRVQLPNDRRFQILSMFPRPELIRVIEGGLTCHADIQMDGQAEVSSDSPLGVLNTGLPFGVSVSAGAGGWLLGRVSFAVYSRVVDAVGICDSQGQWVLTRQDKPLDGRSHLFGLVVSVPRRASVLELKANVYAILSNLTSLYTWPVRLEQPNWTDLTVLIQKSLPRDPR